MDERTINRLVEMEFRMRELTKYINRTLRVYDRIESWSFSAGRIHEDCLELTIDYYPNKHTRDIFNMEAHDVDELKHMFDTYFDGHVRELGLDRYD